VAKWQDVRKVATIAPDYAYGRDAVGAFVEYIKKLASRHRDRRPGMAEARGADFTAFITAQMGKKPDAVFCDVFGGDFASLVKQATPLGYFKAISESDWSMGARSARSTWRSRWALITRTGIILRCL